MQLNSLTQVHVQKYNFEVLVLNLNIFGYFKLPLNYLLDVNIVLLLLNFYLITLVTSHFVEPK